MSSIYLPLHYGKAPYWLLERMKKLAKPIILLIIQEFGEKEFFERMSNPIFFQSFSNVLGFDWNSSGTTTVLTGVLKSVLNTEEFEVKIAGGKGKSALNTPDQIRELSNDLGLRDSNVKRLIEASKMAAKVDNAVLQDGYDIYHHAILFSKKYWTVIQQGMNAKCRMARRYHWEVYRTIPQIEDVHSGIVAERREGEVINLVSNESREARKILLDLIKEGRFKRDYQKLISIKKFRGSLHVPRRIDWNSVERAYELQPEKFEDLLFIRGFGKGVIRALALISDLIYNVEYDKQDPAKYCFAVGGKDGVPFPVDKKTYDEVIEFMRDVIKQAEISDFERRKMIQKLG
ncbi:DUF763 domain-containing protein [Archaeoglobales archaeon]|nr:MAG: DUF763 domain-containing protein [Archaeoglobales archaeon]